jgi:glycosyltransferase involved in cell wall biosynthesis
MTSNNKPKILRIITRLNIGGPAIHAILLSGSLNEDGYRDILIAGEANDSEGDMRYLAKERNVAPVIIREMSREINFRKDFTALLKLYKLMRKERPDIVHTHTAKAGALGRIAAVMAGVPIRIHTFHGHIFDGYFNVIKSKIFLIIERLLAFFTSIIVTISEKVREEMVFKLKVTAADKCIVIPLGLDLDKFLAVKTRGGDFLKEIGSDRDTILIGIIGRLVPIKNHALFLDSVSMFLRDKPSGYNVKFPIIGDGEERRRLEEYVSTKGLNGAVIFTGWVEELASVYSDLDVVVLTSLNEGTPVALIEAMASGKAVISTTVGGVTELIENGENGLLVESRDTYGLSRAMLRLAEDPMLRAKLGNRAREDVKNKYSKQRLVKDIEGLYGKFLKEKCS